MKQRSKRYEESVKQVNHEKIYSLKDAVSIIKAMKPTKFDQSVDLHFKLNSIPRNRNRWYAVPLFFPWTGKTIRVAVFCRGEQERVAKEAGAELVGSQDLIDKVAGGFLDFDCVIATPDMMKDLSKLGKVLGPRGLCRVPKRYGHKRYCQGYSGCEKGQSRVSRR
jgi:large subunit ribosomal protein L1